MAAEPPEKPFALFFEIPPAEFLFSRKGCFWWGASAGLPGQALGLSLHDSASIALEIGSRFFVDCSQAV